MAERVSTGGLKIFENRGTKAELDEERKKSIQEGYEKYYERKRRERRDRNILIIVVVLVLLVLGLIIFF